MRLVVPVMEDKLIANPEQEHLFTNMLGKVVHVVNKHSDVDVRILFHWFLLRVLSPKYAAAMLKLSHCVFWHHANLHCQIITIMLSSLRRSLMLGPQVGYSLV